MRTRVRGAALSGVTIAIAVAVSLLSAPAESSTLKVERFRTPSGRINCGYLATSGASHLRCDISPGLRPEPRRPCPVDWVGITMRSTGRAAPTCAGDTIAWPGSRVLAYGSTWRRGGFVCRSRRVGLTCTNRSQRGFFLSRERWRVF
jgi:hypothetical protein